MSLDRLLYTRNEAARVLSVSLSTLEVLITRGVLRPRRIGRRVWLPAAELQKFAAKPPARLWPPKQNGKTSRSLHHAGIEAIAAEASA
jgi:excisionase family DNA binding protein